MTEKIDNWKEDFSVPLSELLNKCIVCGTPTNNWFCPKHTVIKEKAYAEARELKLTNWLEIVALRDKRLNEDRNP